MADSRWRKWSKRIRRNHRANVRKLSANQSDDRFGAEHAMPTVASLRRLIQSVFRNDVDFDSFCLDYFEEVHWRFTKGMEFPQKINILLEQANRRSILEKIYYRYSEHSEIESWHNIIEWEFPAKRVNKSLKNRRYKRFSRMLFGYLLGDWVRRIWHEMTPEMRIITVSMVLLSVFGYGVNYVVMPRANHTVIRRGSAPRPPLKIPFSPPTLDDRSRELPNDSENTTLSIPAVGSSR